jgi:hypothetical protein
MYLRVHKQNLYLWALPFVITKLSMSDERSAMDIDERTARRMEGFERHESNNEPGFL